MHRSVGSRIVAGLAILLVLGCAQRPASTTRSRPDADARERARETILTTEYDDERVGELGVEDVASEMGMVTDPAVQAYVAELGKRLTRHLAGRRFDYEFTIIDQFEPNAFALPGGHVFVSRGLLALVNTEDELANVLGHEIIHAAERHAAARQAAALRQNPLALPVVRFAQLAAYGREQERAADEGGQRLAARAGYDPNGMTTFLDRLGSLERLELGFSRMPGFFDTHPGTTQRTAATAARAQELAWSSTTDRLGDHLSIVEGLLLGTNPAEGVFDGSLFLHPDLGFQIRFPDGWRRVNTHRAVGAHSPRGDALVFLTLEPGSLDPETAAEDFLRKSARDFPIEVRRSSGMRVGTLPAWRVDASGKIGGRVLQAQLTFVPFGRRMFRISAVAPSGGAATFVGRARNVARSFAPLSAAGRASVKRSTLHVVKAKPGESLESLTARTQSTLAPIRLAVLNGLFVDSAFRGGERIKIARSVPYVPKNARRGQAQRDETALE